MRCSLKGFLIEAKDLVNGVSLVQAESEGGVEYFHIELETHDAIFAEGAPSETFVDDGGGAMFGNAHLYHELYPGASAASVARYCAPRLESGYEVERVRQHIAVRAGLLQLAGARVGKLRGSPRSRRRRQHRGPGRRMLITRTRRFVSTLLRITN